MHDSSFVQLGAASNAIGSTSATSTVTVDAKRADEAMILVSIPAATATNSSYTLSSLLVKAGDTTAVSSATTIITGGTDFTIPTNNDTSAPATIKLTVPGPLTKRYLFVQTTPSAAINVSVFALLHRFEETPSDSEDGFDASFTYGE